MNTMLRWQTTQRNPCTLSQQGIFNWEKWKFTPMKNVRFLLLMYPVSCSRQKETIWILRQTSKKDSLIWNSYRFPVSYKSKKGAENVKIQAKVSIWKETTKPCRKQTPSYTEAQVTLTQEETEHSADQNLIRVQAKFKTVLVYYRAWCSVEVPESTLLLATIITWGRKARLAVWKVSEVCVMTRAWKYY